MPTLNGSGAYDPLHAAWIARLYSLVHVGRPVNPRGQQTVEELDEQIVFDSEKNLLDVPARKLNYRFAVAEWLWMCFGRNDVATLARYNSQMSHFSDDGIHLTGAYGPHVCFQKDRVLERLRADPTTRQAVIEIPRPIRPTKDEPCTLSLQFLLRDNRLNCIATMRSSDVWLGIPYDAFSFSQIQNCLAGELQVQRGWTSMRFGSSHLYEVDRAAALKVLAGPSFAWTLDSPALPGWPPAWLERILEGGLPGPNYLEVIDSPWWRYAAVLMCANSTTARGIL